MSIENSTHKAEVIKIKTILPHPNADRLEIVKVFDFECCIGIGQFKVGDLVVYIQPDSIVPDSPEYYFLKHKDDGDSFPLRHRRISAKTLRGVCSQGLLVSIPKGIAAKEGDDLAKEMKIEHYEPQDNGSLCSGDKEKTPKGDFPSYDIDNFRRYADVFSAGEEVVATEKIHGAQFIATYNNGRFYVRSSGKDQWKRMNLKVYEYFADTFKKKLIVKALKFASSKLKRKWAYKTFMYFNVSIGDKVCDWWTALLQSPETMDFLRRNEGSTVYGEMYGKVQNLKYGIPGKVKLAVFDIRYNGRWRDWHESQAIQKIYDLPWVPVVYKGPFNKEKLIELAEGRSIVEGADNIMEGLVIKPIGERWDERLNGRVQLKLVSNQYLETKIINRIEEEVAEGDGEELIDGSERE